MSTLLKLGNRHCARINNQARDMFETLAAQMKEAEGVTKQLKAENQLN
ncbi:MAG: TnpV protein [Ruminococcaceae bacterium]|nr:TnpV protein [Oscillospiraceae bacterium]